MKTKTDGAGAVINWNSSLANSSSIWVKNFFNSLELKFSKLEFHVIFFFLIHVRQLNQLELEFAKLDFGLELKFDKLGFQKEFT